MLVDVGVRLMVTGMSCKPDGNDFPESRTGNSGNDFAASGNGAAAVIDDFRDKRVTVMGLGSFGGGIGVVQFLAGRGAVVTVTDLKPAAELSHALAAIGDLPDMA